MQVKELGGDYEGFKMAPRCPYKVCDPDTSFYIWKHLIPQMNNYILSNILG